MGKSSAPWGRAVAAVLFVASIGACNTVPTLSATPGARVGQQLTRGDRWIGAEGSTHTGLGVDLRWHPWAENNGFGRGVSFGVDEATMPVLKHTLQGRREHLLVGWGDTPRRPGSAWDFGGEASLVPIGWSRIYYEGHVESAVTLGVRGGPMLKLPCHHCECDDGLWATRHLIVLEGGWNFHRPLVRGNGPPWLGEATATLAYRLDVSLLP